MKVTVRPPACGRALRVYPDVNTNGLARSWDTLISPSNRKRDGYLQGSNRQKMKNYRAQAIAANPPVASMSKAHTDVKCSKSDGRFMFKPDSLTAKSPPTTLHGLPSTSTIYIQSTKVLTHRPPIGGRCGKGTSHVSFVLV